MTQATRARAACLSSAGMTKPGCPFRGRGSEDLLIHRLVVGPVGALRQIRLRIFQFFVGSFDLSKSRRVLVL